MNQNEVNRIITEKVLGECWHETGIDMSRPIGRELYCKKGCEATYPTLSNHPDFSHWEYYGPLLEKIQGERYWDKVAFDGNGRYEFRVNTLLNPTRGSHAIAEFVVDMEVKP